MFCKKGVPKDFKKFLEKYLCRSQESLVKASPCEFCGIFRNIYFVEHLWTHTCLKWSNDKIYWHKYIHRKPRWSCPLKYSCRFKGLQHRCLQFYLKGTQSQILSCKTCEVLPLLLGNCFWFSATFLTYRFLYQQYTNSVTTSCLGIPDISTCKSSTLLTLKMLKGNKKKPGREQHFGAEVDSVNKRICSRSSRLVVFCEKSAVKYLELPLLSAISCCTTPQRFH